jgi:hypothetical protein
MKMEAAAKDRSGPNVARAMPGILSVQEVVSGVCGRKNDGPRAKANIAGIYK